MNLSLWLITRSAVYFESKIKLMLYTLTYFKWFNSRSEFLFRTFSVATSLVMSLILILCRALVNTEWFRNHSSFVQRILPLLVNTEPFRKPLVLLVRMRNKLVVLLVSPHFEKVRTNELLLLLMKWTGEWWFFICAIFSKVMDFRFFILFYFSNWINIFLFPFRNIFLVL